LLFRKHSYLKLFFYVDLNTTVYYKVLLCAGLMEHLNLPLMSHNEINKRGKKNPLGLVAAGLKHSLF
jgi:hypothetical protein